MTLLSIRNLHFLQLKAAVMRTRDGHRESSQSYKVMAIKSIIFIGKQCLCRVWTWGLDRWIWGNDGEHTGPMRGVF